MEGHQIIRGSTDRECGDNGKALLRGEVTIDQYTDIIEMLQMALGGKGHLPSGYSVSSLWVVKQFTWQIPTGQMLGSFKKYPPQYPVGIL